MKQLTTEEAEALLEGTTSRAMCAECGRVFSTDSHFDHHRRFTCGHRNPGQHSDTCWETRRCWTDKELSSHLVQNEAGIWHAPAENVALDVGGETERDAEAV